MENSATPTRVFQLHRCFPLAVQPPTLLLDGAQTQIAPNRPDPPPPAKKKMRIPVLRAPRQPWRQGDNQTHLRRAKMCTEMCATVRAGGGEKEQSWCAVTLQRERGEGPSCAPDYGPMEPRGK